MTDAGAKVLSPDDADDARFLDELRADPCVTVFDTVDQQQAGLRSLVPTPEPDVLAESPRWVYYPWRRSVVRVLGPKGYKRLRLDRNRNLITLAEQDRLSSLKVGVVGLSVGHAIAHTLAQEAVCGMLRLADFDHLELSNLNRVPATVFDLGVNKATAAARRIAELDPYLHVQALTEGLSHVSLSQFLDELDVVIEECDSLDLKVAVRTAARARGIPVLMATSDRGLFDVERYDNEPDRPILHGLLSGTDLDSLAGLSSADKVPHVLRVLDAAALSPRTAASLVEVGETLQTWPQRAGDVAVGAAAVVEAVRRIGLAEDLTSGRVRVDVAAALGQLVDPLLDQAAENTVPCLHEVASDSLMASVAAAAIRAPSGGNSQPWRLEQTDTTLVVDIDPDLTSAMDVALRGSAVAVGAATFNARVAAQAHGCHTAVQFVSHHPDVPLRAAVELDPQADAPDLPLAPWYQPMLLRETNRRAGVPTPLSADAVAALHQAADGEGARVTLVTDRAQIDRAAVILAAADRIRFLTHHLHTEMMSELRWPTDPDPDTGIEVASLELDAGKLAALEILRRPEVMACLAEWDAGAALGDDMAQRVRTSSALAVVSVDGHELADYARGGSAVEAVWIAAQRAGLAVQPVSPAFLYAHDALELTELSPTFDDHLAELQRAFSDVVRPREGESLVLVLRLSHVAAPASKRSRRRRDDAVTNERSA